MDSTNTARKIDEDTVVADVATPKRKRKTKASKLAPVPPVVKPSSDASSPLATVPIADLRKALGRLSGVVDAKSTMPMLQRVRVVGHDNVIRLGATDLDVSMLVDLVGHTESSLGVTFECRRMRDLLRVLPDGDVTLSYEKGPFGSVSTGRCDAKLEAITDRDFPSIPEHKGDWHTIDAGILRGMIEDTLPTVCHDETRFHLAGACLESATGERMVMVSTDGHRLTKSQRHVATAFQTRRNGERAVGGVIVPERALKELRRNLVDGPCKIAMDGRFVFVKQNDWTLITKTIDAQFPPYEQVIPKDAKILVTVDKAALIEACKRSKVFASETRGVCLTLKSGALSLRADHPDAGELVETIDADYAKGENESFGVNPAFLLTALEAMEGELVVLALQNELDPILVRSIDDAAMRKIEDAELLVVVMPMRI